MPKLAASVSWMFQEVPLLERFELAAQVGFRAVEMQAPYSEPASALAERARDAGIETVLMNTPVALAAVAQEQEAFRAGMEQALEYATTLDCQQIHCLAGDAMGLQAQAAFVENLAWSADLVAPHGIDIMIEPINTRDRPGYYLTHTMHACTILNLVKRENVRLQYDCYHMQIMEGQLSETIVSLLDLIGHIQISGKPDRCEPDDQQEIDYRTLLPQLDEIGYTGWVGCEYRPRDGTLAGLGWARDYGIDPSTASGE